MLTHVYHTQRYTAMTSSQHMCRTERVSTYMYHIVSAMEVRYTTNQLNKPISEPPHGVNSTIPVGVHAPFAWRSCTNYSNNLLTTGVLNH